MDFIGYHSMLTHGQSTPWTTGCCRVGSASLRGRAVVCERAFAGGGHAHVGGQSADGAPVVPGVARAGAKGLEGRGPVGTEAPAGPPGTGPRGAGVGARTAPSRLRDGAVDAASRGDAHRATDGCAVSPGSRVVHPAPAQLVPAAPRTPGARARRGRHSAVGRAALARG